MQEITVASEKREEFPQLFPIRIEREFFAIQAIVFFVENEKKHILALEQLNHLPGAEVVHEDSARLAASFDSLKISRLPDVLFRIREASAVGAILKVANQYGIPVTSRGAGSSTTGSATPLNGGWVLDFSPLNGVRIDAVAGIAFAQAGVTIAALQDAAAKQQWFYPPDPSSLRYATVGGSIATNAGGLRGAKYGVTRDYVLGLKGFFANGEPFAFGRAVRKYSAGFNMRDLMIGSEGCLGIVTEAILRLVPLPETRWTCLAVFASENAALEAVQAIVKARVLPSILEFLDSQTVACTLKKHGSLLGISDATVSLLLIELDGSSDAIESEKIRLQEVIRQKTVAWKEADTESESERLWEIRRNCSQAMFQMGDTKLNEDVVVPIHTQPELIAFTLDLKRRYGLATPTFGHAADGNFHVNIMYNKADAAQSAHAEKAVLELMEKAVALGGAISGEHGIGLAKTPFLSLQYSQAEIDSMQSVKQALDPNGILNPGKIFTPFNVWEHNRIVARLPWDK